MQYFTNPFYVCLPPSETRTCLWQMNSIDLNKKEPWTSQRTCLLQVLMSQTAIIYALFCRLIEMQTRQLRNTFQTHRHSATLLIIFTLSVLEADRSALFSVKYVYLLAGKDYIVVLSVQF